MDVVSSTQNPTIKRLRMLQQTKGRKEQGRFLLEGTHLVQEAVAMAWPLTQLCATERWAAANERLLASISNTTEIIKVTEHVLAGIATTQTPDGVIGIALDQKIAPLPATQVNLGLAVDRIQNPDNLGALIRASAALGSDGVWVGNESVDRTNPKVLRASVGQWLRQPPRRYNLDDWLTECRSASLQIFGADAFGTHCWELKLDKPTMIVLGNEGGGIHPSLQRHLDGMIAIPMSPQVESLNVATAGSILLYEAMRQRRKICNTSDA